MGGCCGSEVEEEAGGCGSGSCGCGCGDKASCGCESGNGCQSVRSGSQLLIQKTSPARPFTEENIIKKSASVCPECAESDDLHLIPMVVYEKDGRALIWKECKTHGVFNDVYWGDAAMYKWASKFEVKGKGLLNPMNPKEHPVCPKDCGLCNLHETHSGLTNVVITNRCDLSCWYCFFYAKEGEPLYEPTREELVQMLLPVKEEKPIGGNSIQLTGGEPTIRSDLVDIVRDIKSMGIDHVQLNTNGITLAHDVELAKNLRAAGVSNLYLSFDGTSARTNPKNHWEVPFVLDTCRKAGIGVVLVPTVINTINDHEVGDIFRFGFANVDIVRAVNYQPVSLVGRMPDKQRERFRITIPDVIKRIEEQTDGAVHRRHWFPVPCTVAISRFIEALRGEAKYELSINPACGMGTYVFKDGDRIVPLPEFFDVEGMYELLVQKTEELKSGKNKYVVLASMVNGLRKLVDHEKQPKELNLAKLFFNILVKHDYHSMGVFHKKSLFLGMMHFQDPYNWDVQRIKKCDIHYATPQGIIPFCTFNVFPSVYRDKIQAMHSISTDEWKRRFPGNVDKDGKILGYESKHKRQFTPEEKALIQEYYDRSLGRKPGSPATLVLPQVANPMLAKKAAA